MSISLFRRQLLKYGFQAYLGFATVSFINNFAKGSLGEDLEQDHSLETRIAQLEAKIPQWLEQFIIPGLGIAIVENQEIVWTKGFGKKSLLSNQLVDKNTIFAAASLSKPLFAYAVLKMVEKGEIELDTPLIEYTAKSYISDPRIELITARMVLSHTTGFPNWSGNASVWIQNTPGTKFGYSGEGYLYLQRVVEEITKQPLGEYMQRLVIEPLGMNSSSYIWQPAYAATAADGHNREGKFKPMNRPTEALSAGSLRTTASDYGQFLLAMMDSGTIDTPLLTRESIEEMLRSQTRISYSVDWGLGWGLEYPPNDKFFWHWGDAGEFKSFAIASRDKQIGVVILTNSENGLQICPPIISVAIGGKHPAFDFWMIDY
jgi:CubicO group peptidase (beta-lactamase class C family)